MGPKSWIPACLPVTDPWSSTLHQWKWKDGVFRTRCFTSPPGTLLTCHCDLIPVEADSCPRWCDHMTPPGHSICHGSAPLQSDDLTLSSLFPHRSLLLSISISLSLSPSFSVHWCFIGRTAQGNIAKAIISLLPLLFFNSIQFNMLYWHNNFVQLSILPKLFFGRKKEQMKNETTIMINGNNINSHTVTVCVCMCVYACTPLCEVVTDVIMPTFVLHGINPSAPGVTVRVWTLHALGIHFTRFL